jgi:hypothetical protein
VHQKKHLDFSGLRKIISERLSQIEDYRQKGKVDYSIHDCFMSGLAMMFFQDPSILEFQSRMQDRIQNNNLKTMFQITDIPKDTQLREVLDNSPQEQVEEIFSDFFHQLQRSKQHKLFEFFDSHYLIPIDGTGYFSSDKINCPSCLTKTTGKHVRYEHQILQAAIVCPGIRQVVPLAPEPIKNTDGYEKQDCEINAGKRIIKKIRKTHPKLKVIITGDSLYSKQPFVDELTAQKMSYILVAKPKDHKVLFEWVNELKQLESFSGLKFTDHKKRTHHYEWYNQVPLNGTKDADMVNFFEYSIVVDGQRTYHNTWVTDIIVTENNVAQLVKGGRAKWKIENETFNTLKNQGYHIEHNYGHGKKNLSNTFYLLNVLAFLIHQILELTDLLYQQCRKKFSARKEYWNQLRCTFRILLFQSWEHMLKLIIDPLNKGAP